MDEPESPGPKLGFESALTHFVERAQEMMSSQSRMRDLIRINNELTSNLDLPNVLRRIVEIGKELLNARYAAMGVIGDEHRLEQFIHIGMPPEVYEQIDHLPEGKGLLGALIDEPQPVRLETIASDPRSSGFPMHHPPMESFLGVPIRVRDEVYGNLYVTDSLNGAFSSDDEELAEALAATAGIAIENARLFDDSTFRARWSAALAETARRLLQDDDDDQLGVIVEEVRNLASADLVSIALVSDSGDEIVVDRASGVGADELTSRSFPLTDTFAGQVIAGREPRMTDDLGSFRPDGLAHEALLGPSMVIPFGRPDRPLGVLIVTRTEGRVPYSPKDLELGVSFASHIGVAVDRAESQGARRRVALLEDRSRIARDLHDHVIQRLFATGLSLQGTAAVFGGEVAEHIAAQVEELDAAIAQIRQSIFAMRRDPESTTVSVRARILEIVDRVSGQMESKPRVTFSGPVDLMASGNMTDDISAVVTEALANVVRHARATKVEVSVTAASGEVSIEVMDNGAGPGDSPKLSGLDNLRHRAESQGGTFAIHQAPGGGTRLAWSVPT
jgi:signal transduction histidine kinase